MTAPFSTLDNLQSAAMHNEIINGINERWAAAQPTVAHLRLHSLCYTDDNIQTAEYYSALQKSFSAFYGLFVDRDDPFSRVYIPYPRYFTPDMLIKKLNLESYPSTTETLMPFRRTTNGHDFFLGLMQPGDIIGPWIFEDMQNALSVLSVTAPALTHEQSWASTSQSQEYNYYDDTRGEAIADCIARWTGEWEPLNYQAHAYSIAVGWWADWGERKATATRHKSDYSVRHAASIPHTTALYLQSVPSTKSPGGSAGLIIPMTNAEGLSTANDPYIFFRQTPLSADLIDYFHTSDLSTNANPALMLEFPINPFHQVGFSLSPSLALTTWSFTNA